MYKASLPFLSSVLYISYQRLLQTIGVLEAQRTQAILDLETLARHQKEALSDPSPLWTSYRNGYKSFLWDFCWYFLKYLLISPAFWFKCVFDHLLSSQMEMGLPRPQRVVQLPDIAWDQYTSGRGDFEREFCDKKCKTRQLQLIFDKVCTFWCVCIFA